jgi:hypothetical protein
MHSRSLRRRARLCAAAAGMAALVSLGLTTTTVQAAAPRSDIPQVGQMTGGQTMTTTTPPTVPAQASVAPTLKAPKVKGF